jgi:HAD superfamily hydrolase (TIGR01509 family)
MPIHAVIFDMDDVLCGYHVETRIACLAEISGRTPDFVRRAIWEGDFQDRSDRGAFSADDYLHEFGRLLGYPLSRAEWVYARKCAMPPFPEMIALAISLKSRFPVALLTNNDALVAETIAELFPEIVPIFGENLYVSAELGVAKPDPACFLTCCERFGVNPVETFFTDDRPENVAGAVQAGLMGHVFLNHAGLVKALALQGAKF